VLKCLETKGFFIHKHNLCATASAHHGQLHILKWLREEKGLKLYGSLYGEAIDGGNHFHVMKWLREQGCPSGDYTFHIAAEKGNLEVLQWLHDEGCSWYESPFYSVDEEYLKPEVIDWLRSNGYGNRIVFRDV